MEWSICGVNEKSESPADKGAGSGICVDVGGIARVWMGGTGVVEEEGVGRVREWKWEEGWGKQRGLN